MRGLLSYVFGPQPEPEGLGRRLGTAECFLIDSNEQGIMIISSVAFVSSAKPFTKSNITWALKRLMTIHPLLRMRVVNYNGSLYWKEMDQREPELRVNLSSDWHTVFSDNAAELFDHKNGPLWRVTFMPNAISDYRDENLSCHSAFVLSFSHAIIDGQARIKLLNDFQDLLSCSLHYVHDDKTSLDNSLPVPESLKISPSYEDFAKKKLGFFDKILLFFITIPFVKQFIMSRFAGKFANSQHPFKQCVGEISEKDLTVQPRTCVYPMVLDRQDTALILKACKMRKLTVQSALQAATLIAISEIIMEGAKEKGIESEAIPETVIGCTAGLRNVMNLSALRDVSYVATLMYGITDDVSVSEWAEPMKFWQLAERTMVKLHTKTDANIKFMLFAQALMTGQMKAMPKKRMHLLAYTNLGNCNYLNREAGSNVKITGHFSASGEHLSGPIFANCITTLDSKMCWGAVYFTNVTSRELAGRYLHRSVNLLLQNCKQTVEENA